LTICLLPDRIREPSLKFRIFGRPGSQLTFLQQDAKQGVTPQVLRLVEGRLNPKGELKTMTSSTPLGRKSYVGLCLTLLIAAYLGVTGRGSGAEPGIKVRAAQMPAASAPYSIAVFATSVQGSYTQPDSIASLGANIFIGYGNGVA